MNTDKSDTAVSLPEIILTLAMFIVVQSPAYLQVVNTKGFRRGIHTEVGAN